MVDEPTMLYVPKAPRGSKLRQFGVPVLAFTLLVVIGRQFTPQSSLASLQDPEGVRTGTLVGPVYNVELVVTDNGPRYTVRTEAGRLLAWQLEADALAREFPSLDMRNATASPIMSAEKHNEPTNERP